MSNKSKQYRIGCCISAHGYGHATRAMAVMEALGRCLPVHFEILTAVPPWLFAETLTVSHRLHAMTTDVGLKQHNPLVEDMPATLKALDDFYPLREASIKAAAKLRAIMPPRPAGRRRRPGAAGLPRRARRPCRRP